MLLTLTQFVFLVLGFFLIAMLYSSVGFGGGSSYLAVLALVFVGFYAIRSTALVCNLVVVSSSTYLYWRKGYLDFKKFLPFVLLSVPFAFLGARFRLSEQIFFMLLGVALIVSALSLFYQAFVQKKSEKLSVRYPKYIAYVLGAGIGLLSGLVGIGGGIFLAPILNHLKWDTSKKVASLASFFILVNSLGGVGGMLSAGTFDLPWLQVGVLILAVFLGGQLGVRLSLSRLTGKGVKIITAVLVLLVGLRVLLLDGL